MWQQKNAAKSSLKHIYIFYFLTSAADVQTKMTTEFRVKWIFALAASLIAERLCVYILLRPVFHKHIALS